MKKDKRNCILLAGALSLSAASFSVTADVFNVDCNVPSLVGALHEANSSPEDSVLELARNCTYTLDVVDNEQKKLYLDGTTYVPMGPNGLPAIASVAEGGKLTIEGNGAMIARTTAAGTPPFRILQVLEAGDVTITGLSIAGGDSCDGHAGTWGGGGIFVDAAKLSLIESAIRNNIAAFGGGIRVNGGHLSLQNTSIENNRARASGGLNANGTIDITSSRIVGNKATDAACPNPSYSSMVDMGGAYIGGTFSITDSLVANNEAQATTIHDGYAGGLYVFGDAGSVSTISNTTISENSAAVNGGLVVYSSAGTVHLNALTITGNHHADAARSGSGLYVNSWASSGGKVIVKSSVVANNTIGGNVFGDCDVQALASAQGNNFDSDGSCTGFTHTTVDALKLGLLTNNGGPTETHALLPGSVAIDAATDCTTVDGNAVTTDQRGVIRPQGNACDVGAFERGDESYVVNNLVSFNVVPGTAKLANDLVGCAGFAKKYRFSALLTNTSDASQPKTLTELAMQVRKLSGGNKLFLDGSATPGALYGEGEHTALPLAGGYADGQVAPRENETVTVNVCLMKVAPFQLLVDVLGKTQ